MNKDADIVLHFWFEEAGTAKWWKKDPDFDYEIKARFLPLMEDAAAGKLDAWAQDPKEALALVLLLDQFPRNVYRGQAQAFATDKKARFLTHLCLERDFLKGLTREETSFMLMPLMHSEDLGDQALCCELFRAMNKGEPHKFAEAHRDIIAKFGRFPHRNECLGRPNTPEEEEFLKDPNSGF
jgi:uncharacterized protein (DUF924 family)